MVNGIYRSKPSHYLKGTIKEQFIITSEWITSHPHTPRCGSGLCFTAYYISLLCWMFYQNQKSLFLWTAQRSSYKPLNVRSDLTCFLCFVFLPLTIALSLFSTYSLSLHLGVNTPSPPPLFSLSKDGEYGNVETQLTFELSENALLFYIFFGMFSFSQLCSAFS